MNFNNDPLLGGGTYNGYPDVMAQIEDEQKKLASRVDEIRRMRQQPQQAQSPIWDEIDRTISGMSDSEVDYLNHNEEYIRSSTIINGILQREYLNIMRPVVERTKDGHEALQNHLELVKKLRKTAKEETSRKYALFDEYMESHSDMTFAEFMDMKKGVTRNTNSKQTAK